MRFKFNRWLGSLLLIAACLSVPVLESGCKKTTLQPGGAYSEAGVGAYQADQVIDAARATVDAFLVYESKNRAALTSMPQITQTADRLRDAAPRALQSAVRANDAYKAAPDPTKRTALDDALRVLRQVAVEAAGFLLQPIGK
jgi:hypothetical protein